MNVWIWMCWKPFVKLGQSLTESCLIVLSPFSVSIWSVFVDFLRFPTFPIIKRSILRIQNRTDQPGIFSAPFLTVVYWKWKEWQSRSPYFSVTSLSCTREIWTSIQARRNRRLSLAWMFCMLAVSKFPQTSGIWKRYGFLCGECSYYYTLECLTSNLHRNGFHCIIDQQKSLLC